VTVPELVSIAMAGVTLIGVGGGGAWYARALDGRVSALEAAYLESRLRTLEDQVRTLIAQNPTRAACYELAVKTVDAEQTPYGNGGKEWKGYRRSERIQSAMADCLGTAARSN